MIEKNRLKLLNIFRFEQSFHSTFRQFGKSLNKVFDRLGLVRHLELLDKFSNRLIGIHLHDIMGLVDDHKSPGMGTFDFKMLKPYLNDGIIKVLEIHQPSGAEQVRRSADFLSKILG